MCKVEKWFMDVSTRPQQFVKQWLREIYTLRFLWHLFSGFARENMNNDQNLIVMIKICLPVLATLLESGVLVHAIELAMSEL